MYLLCKLLLILTNSFSDDIKILPEGNKAVACIKHVVLLLDIIRTSFIT